MFGWNKLQLENIPGLTNFTAIVESFQSEIFRRDSLFIQANTERTLFQPFARVWLSSVEWTYRYTPIKNARTTVKNAKQLQKSKFINSNVKKLGHNLNIIVIENF